MSSNPEARIIIYAWGKKYVDVVLGLTIPAVLAPGNVPTLAEHFDCTFVFLTEEGFFSTVECSRAWKALGQYVKLKLLPLDDLVACPSHYGVSLTLALLRGIEDLGPRMTDTFLLFLNADFILADGSYRSLTKKMLAGERLIHAPSYCVIEENVVPLLDNRLHKGVLSIPPRDMSAMILANRHYTIRAKTINQKIYRMHRHDQFYYEVDHRTLIGRQLPIALVCMKPERAVTDMHTFWDYGVVSEFCPTTIPCVLGDSDDFLMLEIREAGAFRNLFRLGHYTTEDIATDLSSFTTQDQRNHAMLPLVVHDADLPSDYPEAQRNLDAYIAEIFGQMKAAPVATMDHPFWLGSYPTVKRMQLEFVRDHPLWGDALPGIVQLRSEARARLLARADSTTASISAWLSYMHGRLLGRLPVVNEFHPYYAGLMPAQEIISEALRDPACRILMIGTECGILARLLAHRCLRSQVVVSGREIIGAEALTMLLTPTGVAAHHGEFNLCIGEFDEKDLVKMDQYLAGVLPVMKKGGRVVIFHFNESNHDLRNVEMQIMEQLMTRHAVAGRVVFVGTIWTAIALKMYAAGANYRSRHSRSGALVLAVLAILAVPFSWLGNRYARARELREMPRHCLSLTIELKV